MSLDDVADRLYGLPPAEFTAARKEQAALAKADKDRELAAAIGALRKPTVAAWATNQLVRRRPEQIEQMLELGAALRRAQQTLDAAGLRELSTQRQQAVRALTDATAAIAEELGQRLGEPALHDIRQTLTAALADPAVAAELRAGRMSASAEYSGFGLVGLTAVPDEPGSEPEPPDETAARAAELAQARAELADATEQSRSTATRLREIDSRIADLRLQLDLAEQERRFHAAAHETALAAAAAAEQRVAEASERSTRD